MTTVKPIGKRIVVRPVSAESKTAGGLFIPDAFQEKAQEGEIVSVGEPEAMVTRDSADYIKEYSVSKTPEAFKPGARVVFAKYGGTEIKIDGETLRVVEFSDVIAVVSKSK